MGRLNRVLAATAVVGVVAAIGATPARAQSAASAQGQSVRTSRGSITGVVSDERGGPLAGAVVSVLGATMAMTVSDVRGRFALDSLPAGEYILQAHLSGFSGSRRELVRVGVMAPPELRLQLHRIDEVIATSGTTTVTARPIMAAGFDLPSITLADQPDSDKDPSADHPHNETAWRLRHLKRSILKNASSVVDVADDDEEVPDGTMFGRAVGSAASFATSLFADLPFTGEVNLLTTGAFAPGELFSSRAMPRGVAYLQIGAPTPAGDWSVRAAMSDGDLSSWLVAGAFESQPGSSHSYSLGLSYSTQEYLGGNPAALVASTENSRNVGELFAFDRWAIGSRVSFEYGARYGHYDYLTRRGLLSPRVGVTLEPVEGTRIITTVAQQMIAPGAEEFITTRAAGPWLPPERTFAPLGEPGDASAFRVERARYVDVTVEHNFDDMYVVGLRRFYQDVDNQLVTLFGVDLPGRSEAVGHYYVASAGALGADGWALRIGSPADCRVQASFDYSLTHARWLSRPDMTDVRSLAPAAVRPDVESLHDFTTTVATAIPETATRVFVLYKVNTGYTRASPELTHPGLDARFDVQVNQALPFAFAGTRWEVLVGVRNLFRDPAAPGSVYDELLVVRPPKRVVGGFLVRF